jgi:hypothetical protein
MADHRPDPARQIALLAGYAPSLPTPFRDTGQIDSAALEWLCHRQVEENAAALVVCGITAEVSTLTESERETILRIAIGASSGRIPVIAAVDSNSTSKAPGYLVANLSWRDGNRISPPAQPWTRSRLTLVPGGVG